MPQQSQCTAKRWEISSQPKLSQKRKHTLRKKKATVLLNQPLSNLLADGDQMCQQTISGSRRNPVHTIENLKRGGDREVMNNLWINNPKEPNMFEQKKPLRCCKSLIKPTLATQRRKTRNAITPSRRSKYIK